MNKIKRLTKHKTISIKKLEKFLEAMKKSRVKNEVAHPLFQKGYDAAIQILQSWLEDGSPT